MNKFLRKLFFALNIILGFIIVLFIVYRRFILIRIPKDLYFINDNIINYEKSIFILFVFISYSYLFYKHICILLKLNMKNNLMSELLLKLNNIIEDALNQTYILVGNTFFSNPYLFISSITNKFYQIFSEISETFFLFILYLVRIIILICFLIDVFVFFRLEYMYKALYLLCISLIIHLLFYILKSFSLNLEEAKSILIIEPQGLDIETGLPLTLYRLKEEYHDLDLQYHIEQYILCSKISGYLENYEKYKSLFTPYFNSIIYSLYSIGWLYILYKNLILFFI